MRECDPAYFRKKLGWARFAWKLEKSFESTPGNTVTIPVMGKLGAAEKPSEDDRVDVDSLGDSSFSATVYEVAKAFGITDAARIRMGLSNDKWEEHGWNQVARVIAELIDSDVQGILAAGDGHDDVRDATNFVSTGAFPTDKSLVAGFATNAPTVRSLYKDMVKGFGDKNSECMAICMHSKHLQALLTDDKAGLLKADALDPFNGLAGFKGRLLSKAIFEIDNITKGSKITVTDSGGATQKFQAYQIAFLKPDPYALMLKREAKTEQARDMLGRRDIGMATKWYTFMTLHKKVDNEDVRALFAEYISDEETT